MSRHRSVNLSLHIDKIILWRTVGILLEPELHSVSVHSASAFSPFFAAKVNFIRATTALASAPQIIKSEVPPFDRFQEVTLDEVLSMIRAAPSKQCTLDPAPTWLVKRMSDILGPVITEMVNLSFEQRRFTDSQKHAILVPRIKKPSLDPMDMMSYRPLSNITFISKLVERIAVSCFNSHAGLFKLLPARQSAYRRFHSIETAVAIVHNNIVREMDSSQVSALVLLDLSAAFSTVDYGTLLEVLSFRFGITGSILEWFKSYLTGRTQIVTTSSDISAVVSLVCGVPQESMVGPLLFIAYTRDIEETIEAYSVEHDLYADDTQLLSQMCIAEIQHRRTAIENCVLAIQDWCASRRLQLNPDKLRLCGSVQDLIWPSYKRMTFVSNFDQSSSTSLRQYGILLCYWIVS